MIRSRFKWALAALVLCSGVVRAEPLIALSDEAHLIFFDSANPSLITGDLALTGIPPNTAIVGLDFRPATGTLVLLGERSSHAGPNIFDVDTGSGAVTPRGAPLSANPQPSGRFYYEAIDVDPATDTLRLYGSAQIRFQDPQYGTMDVLYCCTFFRSNLDTGARIYPVDANVSPGYGVAGDPITAATVGNLTNGFRPWYHLSGIAHTPEPIRTTLYAILYNTGELVRVGSQYGAPDSADSNKLEPVGPLGFSVGTKVPFDISASGVAYILTGSTSTSASAPGSSQFGTGEPIIYLRTVDLVTGAASAPLMVGRGEYNLIGLAAAPILPAGSGGGGGSPMPIELLGLLGAAACRRWGARWISLERRNRMAV